MECWKYKSFLNSFRFFWWKWLNGSKGRGGSRDSGLQQTVLSFWSPKDWGLSHSLPLCCTSSSSQVYGAIRKRLKKKKVAYICSKLLDRHKISQYIFFKGGILIRASCQAINGAHPHNSFTCFP